MTCIIEIEPIEGTDLYKIVGTNTLVFDERGIENILTPYEEPKREIDWAKVPRDTPVLVWEEGQVDKQHRHFAEYKDGVCRVYQNGTTSWSTKEPPLWWRHCELAFPEEAREEWYKK